MLKTSKKSSTNLKTVIVPVWKN